MIVLDANLLLYAYVRELPFHKEAHAWLSKTFSEAPLIGIPWQSAGAFLRVATNVRLSAGDLSTEKVLAIVERWFQLPNVRALSQSDNHWPVLKRVLRESGMRGSRVSDAQLAAITLENGGTLYTTDRDFARFPGLRWINPLSP